MPPPNFVRALRRRPLMMGLLTLMLVTWGGSVLAATSPGTISSPKVKLGIDVLAEDGFKPLKGKRVGLLTNQAGVNNLGVSTIDVLRRAPGVNLVALYGPEHGIDGTVNAGDPVKSTKDPRTGLPVYSLYDANRRPTPAMLKDIDVMVIDLQDLGARSYTFASCMLYTMEACFEAGKAVMVLDRPNPLGGLKVGGPMIEPGLMSYVGAVPVPYVHGLTIGELARMAKDNPGWLKGPDEKAPMAESVRKSGQLTVVPMQGWRRSMQWPDTGLKWVGTSPKIPTVAAAFGYAMAGLAGELGAFSHGVGTPYPFRLLNFPGKTPEQIIPALQARNLTGLDFIPMHYKDAAGTERSGVYVVIKDWNEVVPTKLAFVMMQLAALWVPPKSNPFNNGEKDAAMYQKLVGSSAWWEEVTKKGGRMDVEGFFKKWQAEDAAFQQKSKTWWLYPP